MNHNNNKCVIIIKIQCTKRIQYIYYSMIMTMYANTQDDLPSILTPIILFHNDFINILLFGINILIKGHIMNLMLRECPVVIQTSVFSNETLLL